MKFAYIHLHGSHTPYVMNEKAEPAAPGTSSAIIQTKGCFHIVYEYLDQLKQLGMYENSTIIIFGDHGARKNDTNLSNTLSSPHFSSNLPERRVRL